MNSRKAQQKEIGIILLRNQGIFDCVHGKARKRKNQHYNEGYNSQLTRPF